MQLILYLAIMLNSLTSFKRFLYLSWDCLHRSSCHQQIVALSHAWPFCDPMDGSPPGSSLQGISQARILEQIAISFSRGSSWPKDRTHVSWIGRSVLYHWATQKAPSANRDGFSPFQLECLLFPHFALGKASSSILNGSGENGHSWLVPDFSWKTFSLYC